MRYLVSKIEQHDIKISIAAGTSSCEVLGHIALLSYVWQEQLALAASSTVDHPRVSFASWAVSSAASSDSAVLFVQFPQRRLIVELLFVFYRLTLLEKLFHFPIIFFEKFQLHP